LDKTEIRAQAVDLLLRSVAPMMLESEVSDVLRELRRRVALRIR
jgi:hypothetical protein